MGVLPFALFIVPWMMTCTCSMLLAGSIARYGRIDMWRAIERQVQYIGAWLSICR